MILSTFRTRVRERLRDVGSTVYHEDSYINNVTDGAVLEAWPILVRKVRHFYLGHQSYTGITDAVGGSSNERYTLPTTFRGWGQLRRTDSGDDRPIVKFVDAFTIDQYRWSSRPYTRDSNVPSMSGEACALYSSTQFQIIPAPAATSYTYDLLFLRAHTTASADGNTVDVPDQALNYLINKVAFILTADDEDPAVQGKREMLSISEDMILREEVQTHLPPAPTVENWF